MHRPKIVLGIFNYPNIYSCSNAGNHSIEQVQFVIDYRFLFLDYWPTMINGIGHYRHLCFCDSVGAGCCRLPHIIFTYFCVRLYARQTNELWTGSRSMTQMRQRKLLARCMKIAIIVQFDASSVSRHDSHICASVRNRTTYWGVARKSN